MTKLTWKSLIILSKTLSAKIHNTKTHKVSIPVTIIKAATDISVEDDINSLFSIQKKLA